MLPSEFVAKAEELGLKWKKEHTLEDGILIKGAHGYASKFFSLEAITSHSKPALEQALTTLKKQDDVQHNYEHLASPEEPEA